MAHATRTILTDCAFWVVMHSTACFMVYTVHTP